MIRLAEQSEDLGPRWRLQGMTPGPEVFAQSLWTGVLAQFIVLQRTSPEPLGLVCAYNADFINDVVYFAAATFHPGPPSSRMAQASFLFLDYLFATWSFRKIYIETAEYNLRQFERVRGRLFVEEGRLKAHWQRGDGFSDQYILALYRETWDRWRKRLMPGVTDPSRDR